MTDTELVVSSERFLALEEEWTALWEVTPHRSVQLTHWWVGACLRHLEPRRLLRIVILRQEGRPVLIAPFIHVTVQAGPFPEHRLQVAGDYKSGPCDFLYTAPEPPLWDALWQAIHTIPDWDCVAVFPIRADSPTVAKFLGSGERRGLSFRRIPDPEGHVVRSAQGWSAFEATLDQKRRHNLRRRLRKLEAEHGPVTVRHISSREELAAVEAALFDLNARTWAGRAGAGLVEFHRALMRSAGCRQALSLEILYAAGMPIAHEVNFDLAGRVTSLAIGYDEAYAQYGPGELLRFEVLRSFFDRGTASLYDFMAGGASHKQAWSADIEPYLKLEIYRATLRASALYQGRRLGSLLKERGGAGLFDTARTTARSAFARTAHRVCPRELPRRHIRVGADTLVVEVAVSGRDIERGLKFRRALAPNAGMLFRVGEGRPSVWMKDTPLPLDVVFMGADGLILRMDTLSPRSTIPVTGPPGTRWFLETHQGWLRARGIAVGDRVELPADLCVTDPRETP